MWNKVTLCGNLGSDPETRTTSSNLEVCRFSVATSSTRTDNNGQKITETQWHNVVAWRKLAEICSKYLKKGSKVLIEGTIKYGKYTDKDGVQRYTTEIHANDMKMLDSKKDYEAVQEQNQNAEAVQETPVDDLPF